MSQSKTINPDDIPGLVKETLVDEFGDSQDRCVRGYVPSQSIQKVMEYLGPEHIQQVHGKRLVKDTTESFKRPGYDLPEYIDLEEQLKRQLRIRFDRAESGEFDWDIVQDFLIDSDLKDIAVSKLVIRMENPDLRDHLFTLLQKSIDYPEGYRKEFIDPFFFVMESRAPEIDKDYRNVEKAHDQSYLKELGWSPRCLDLLSIWSYRAWVNSGNKPMGVTQREVEELAFNQRESNEPVFGAVNSMLVVNRWRSPFGRGMTDLRYYDWTEQKGWERTE